MMKSFLILLNYTPSISNRGGFGGHIDLVFNIYGFAQIPNSTGNQSKDQPLYHEKSAEPVGGVETFYEYIAKKSKYPKAAKKNNIEGTVFLQFAVDIDGSLTDIVVLKGLGYGCDEVAIRLLKKAPKWKPGLLQGKPVKQTLSVPILFRFRE